MKTLLVRATRYIRGVVIKRLETTEHSSQETVPKPAQQDTEADCRDLHDLEYIVSR